MRIATVVGNRPQFVKAAAVSHLLREHHEEVMLHTGQHYDDELSRIFFDELDIPRPEIHLELGRGSNIEQTGRMMSVLERELERVKPDAVLVYGDTNTTLAAAISAAHMRIPLIHIEAGMRSFDRKMPEEVNRVLTDHVSGLCLCSTAVAVENLRREGVEGVLVGDVMADVVLQFAGLAAERSQILEAQQLPPGEFALITAHRAGNVDDPGRLEQLVALLEALPLTAFYPVHPRSRKRLTDTGLLERLASAPNVVLHSPVGYLDLLHLAASARAVITDSGGLQKEAYVLGTPCLTLRDRTEWVETVETGWNTLVDLSTADTLHALEREPPAQRPDIYRAGRAGEAVVEAISAWTPGLTMAAGDAPTRRAIAHPTSL